MAWYPRYCEVSQSALSHPAPFLSQNCQISARPKINWPLYLLHFTHSSKAYSPFLAWQARNHQSEIGPRHIEKVIWGQNQTNLHKILLTGLWSFLADLFEIWSTSHADCSSGSHWKLHDAWDERRDFCAAFTFNFDFTAASSGQPDSQPPMCNWREIPKYLPL